MKLKDVIAAVGYSPPAIPAEVKVRMITAHPELPGGICDGCSYELEDIKKIWPGVMEMDVLYETHHYPLELWEYESHTYTVAAGTDEVRDWISKLEDMQWIRKRFRRKCHREVPVSET